MEGADRPVRVLIVDDNEDFLFGILSWVSSQPELHAVGIAKSGAAALDVVERLAPDLVLMDAEMPGVDGFEATRRLKSNATSPVVVILTLHDTRVARNEAWAAGADGFVPKDEVTDQLLKIIREIFSRKRKDRDHGDAPRVEKGSPSPGEKSAGDSFD